MCVHVCVYKSPYVSGPSVQGPCKAPPISIGIKDRNVCIHVYVKPPLYRGFVKHMGALKTPLYKGFMNPSPICRKKTEMSIFQSFFATDIKLS